MPPGYECLNETVDGHYGGVNAGGYFNFNKRSGPFLAYKQSREHSAAITAIVIRDVDEYYEENPHLLDGELQMKSKSKSSLMSQFKKRLSASNDVVATATTTTATAHCTLPPPSNSNKWELIDGNLNRGSLGHTLQIWIERDTCGQAIIDLLLINENKKEHIPYGFDKIEVSLNQGAPHRDRICLCYKQRACPDTRTKDGSQLFTPQIIDRYPAKDYDEFALTENVAAFCFPRGMEVIGGVKRASKHHRDSAQTIDVDSMDLAQYDYTHLIHESSSHTFVLSSDIGTRIYGACIIFYEEVPSVSHADYISLYIPKAICVLSHYPFYSGFLVFLNHVYCISMSPANAVPIEKYISHFFESVPLPLRGHPGVEYSIGTKRHIFSLNARYNLADIDFPLQYLFRCLSCDDIIHLIGAILLEKQIVLHSCCYALITPCAEALRSLIWPFEYQYNFIPVLPQSFARILEAPVPFIFGMHRSSFDSISLTNIVSVDLDNHCITLNRRRITAKHSSFPKRLRAKLKQRLSKYVELALIHPLQRAFNIADAADLNENEYFDAQAVRLSFVQCFIEMFRYYRNYLEYTQLNSLVMTFDRDKFAHSLPDNIRKFVRELMKTHSFQRFIDLRCGDDAVAADLITFDYMISKTLGAVQPLNVDALNRHNNMETAAATDSDTNTITSSSSRKRMKRERKRPTEHRELESDLIRQLNELQLEDPYTKYEVFRTESADTNPSDAELAQSPYTYDDFPALNSKLMNEYKTNWCDSLLMNGAPKFGAIHYSTQPTLRDKLKADSMAQEYEVFVVDTIAAFNALIDGLDRRKNEFATKTMSSSIACFIDKIYQMWLSMFAHHSINRLSIHTVSPKRDFILCLRVFESMLRGGFAPTELVLREMALIPAHCAMYRELVILDRWMIRLGMMPSAPYLQRIMTANARRSHVEYRKFEQYYGAATHPSSIHSYPFTHALDCAPESFFDYFLTKLPHKMLLSGKCLQCKHRLSGEEILAGFQNLKLSQNANGTTANNVIKNDKISIVTPQTQPRKRSASDTQFTAAKKVMKRASLSIAENPHLPPQTRQKKKTEKADKTTHRRSGQWSTLCPFCNTETVAKLEMFGGVVASEYKSQLNQFQSMSMMDSNGISMDPDSAFRKTFNLFSYERLHERIGRIINNAAPYYPSTKLPYSFASHGQDRAIKIIRSKEELFWNLFFYFKLIELPTEFLFGGMFEFESSTRIHYSLAALPHHSWCLLLDGDGKRDGLQKYYSADKMLKRVHPTLYASLKPMVYDRLYDALILVLQQRGVIQEEMTSSKKRTKMHQFVMNEPLYRLFGKLQNGMEGRERYMVYSKSFNKSCERLSYTHKTRLILPQDKGISATVFAHRIQDMLLLCRDTYHHKRPTQDHSFHHMQTNHTYSQLLQVSDRAKQHQIQPTTEIKQQDFLFGNENQSTSTDYLFDSSIKYGHIKANAVTNNSGQSESNLMMKAKPKYELLSPKKRVQKPCYVPRLRVVLNDEFWMTQYRWYIYYFQPRRIKYIYFILLIQEFYKFRRFEGKLSLPQTFSFYFANQNNKTDAIKTHNIDFDLSNMNPQTQNKLNCKQYALFIYYHFVHKDATHKIQFSDPSIVTYIEQSLFDKWNLKIFDKMWNAVFRYLHQMTYEPFVIWMNTK
eukprot:47507_1